MRAMRKREYSIIIVEAGALVVNLEFSVSTRTTTRSTTTTTTITFTSTREFATASLLSSFLSVIAISSRTRTTGIHSPVLDQSNLKKRRRKENGEHSSESLVLPFQALFYHHLF
ncbi:unnamed protein product [Orchesella dallaii]|uniref:Uncharacterized protein n=1 Tax=Orchesella dallaii TaxID=48710 RepID=A0ABP1QUZ6_9HEXA